MTQEKEIHFTGYEHQISTWRDLNPTERFTLLILQQLAEVSKDPRGTYITNERMLVRLYPYHKKLYKSLYINSFSLIFSTIKLSIKLFILCTYKSLVDIYFINLTNPIA